MKIQLIMNYCSEMTLSCKSRTVEQIILTVELSE